MLGCATGRGGGVARFPGQRGGAAARVGGGGGGGAKGGGGKRAHVMWLSERARLRWVWRQRVGAGLLLRLAGARVLSELLLKSRWARWSRATSCTASKGWGDEGPHRHAPPEKQGR